MLVDDTVALPWLFILFPLHFIGFRRRYCTASWASTVPLETINVTVRVCREVAAPWPRYISSKHLDNTTALGHYVTVIHQALLSISIIFSVIRVADGRVLPFSTRCSTIRNRFALSNQLSTPISFACASIAVHSTTSSIIIDTHTIYEHGGALRRSYAVHTTHQVHSNFFTLLHAQTDTRTPFCTPYPITRPQGQMPSSTSMSWPNFWRSISGSYPIHGPTS